MEIQPLIISLAGIIAVAAIVGIASKVRLEYSDELQLASDIYRAYITGGCVVSSYRLDDVVVNSSGVYFPVYVVWEGRATNRIPLPTANNTVFDGFYQLKTCFINGSLIITRVGG